MLRRVLRFATGGDPSSGRRRRALGNLGTIAFWLGLHRLLLRKTTVVVAFHRVNDVTAGDALTCGVEEFRRYCRFFARHFRVVSFGSLIRAMENGEDTSGSLAITFDDGYLDNHEIAAPILRSMNLPATFFITSRFIGSDTVPWWDEQLAVQPGWMTWDQVRDLRAQGFEVGSHTATHLDLGRAPVEQIAADLRESRVTLEAALGERVDLFAYPYGRPENISEEARAIVREVGFRSCPSCHGGLNGQCPDPLYLNRIPISDWHASVGHWAFEVATRRA